MAEVLDRVFEKVKGRLTEADRERLPSGTDVRWRNTAAWERVHALVAVLEHTRDPEQVRS